MFERIYLASMIDIIVAWLKHRLISIKEFFINLTLETKDQTQKDDAKHEIQVEKNNTSKIQGSLEGIGH